MATAKAPRQTPEDKRPVCFSIMPFAKNFDDISKILKQCAEQAGMRYVRGDLRNQPGSVMSQIIRDIRGAAVVIADITGHNPNVFYELGIAHQEKGTERVVIITQSTANSPYDVHEFRQHCYEHSDAGRKALKASLPAVLEAALKSDPDSEHWNVIRGRLQRTKIIVRDLQRLLEPEPVRPAAGTAPAAANPQGTIIRIAAGLGSLAISDDEPVDQQEGEEYNYWLLEERNWLREALVRGARLRMLLNPPRVFAQHMVSDRLKARYRRLIRLLRGESDQPDETAREKDLLAIRNCEWALNPVPMPNQLILGERVAYEGFKRSSRWGFERTHCETSPAAISALITDFDRHFRACAATGLTPAGIADELQTLLDEAIARETAAKMVIP